MEAMLVRFVEKLIASLGQIASDERKGALSAPIEKWQGRDVIDYVAQLRRATSDEFMGLGVSSCPLGTADFLIELMSRCSTLRDAIDFGIRFMRIASDAVSIELEQQGNMAAIVIRQKPSVRDPDFALSDWLMISWHKLAQFLVSTEIPLERTEFVHALESSYTAYSTMFGGECLFNRPECRLVFHSSYLDRRVVKTIRDARQQIDHKVGYFSRPPGLATTWSQSIKNILRAELHMGAPLSSLENLAEEFGVSSQTLRRRLRVEGTSFRKLKQDTRHEVALDVLCNERATVSAASLAAGFAEPSALTRALKATRGINSLELRKQISSWRGDRATH